jgi:hypothetical protein
LAYKKRRRLVQNDFQARDDPLLPIPKPAAASPPTNKRVPEGEDEIKVDDVAVTATEETKMRSNSHIADERPAIESKVDQTSCEGAVDPLNLSRDDKKKTQTQDFAKKKRMDNKPETPFLPHDGVKMMEENFEPQDSDIIVGLRKRSAEHPG